ncbi:MBL fold metallo-hydrolase [Phytopseudomonas dryadis]|uniref:MBL fold metallo-hydrolase n=1 Tax=Phytopseudomonas dryadis TaxID=2487520 RepID=A0A4Q9QT90_9GAMM|nr:MBL fold metallo-hydrolase [Pseudomonas dryadis]TBU85230.1 MBL fold metallo-hydrolase [Pseudomonas dryadis]
MTSRPVATAREWYHVDRLADGVTHIQERFIDPFYRCNIWHVRGRDRDLLFDSGMGVVSLKQMLPWLRLKPLLAVASHAHFDHIGCHHEFTDRACHRAEAAILARPDGRETLADRFAVIDMFERLPPGGYRQADYRVPAAPATHLLEAGDVIDLGDRHFEVLHVPGHSPGSIALWEARSGILLSGDAVYDGPLVDDAHHSHLPDYLDTLHRLREMPANVVHGGHFQSFGRQRLQRIIDEYLAGKRAAGCPAP